MGSSGRAAPARASLRQTATQTIPNAAWTTVLFDVEDLDSHGGHAASDSRYTAQVAGWYLVAGSVSFLGNLTGRRGTRIAKNGAGLNGSSVLVGSPGIDAVGIPTRTLLVNLAVNEYVELQAFQESGGNLDTNAVTPDAQPNLVVFRVST